MTQKKTDPKAKRRKEICERFGYYHDHLFHGQTREMARTLGITHSVISKIRRGLQGPGEQVLAALESHKQVNSRWLLEGEGEPILPLTGGTLPIALDILPDRPALHPDLLTGERYPVSAERERDTRYWLRLYDTHPLVQAPHLCMLPNDLLLVETDLAHFGRPDVMDNTLCAIELPRSTAPQFTFAAISVQGDKIFAKLFLPALTEDAKDHSSTSSDKRYFGFRVDAETGGVKRRRRAIGRLNVDDTESNELAKNRVQTDDIGEANPSATHSYAGGQRSELSGLEQIVGLVIGMERPSITIRL